MLPTVTATRYVTPLREGGSLPGLMEADDLGTYAVKFHGAGQGRKVLVAEIISGELARSLGLPVPRLVLVELDPVLAAGEPDEEVQALLRASSGLNLGVDYLPGSLDLDSRAFEVSPEFAGRVLWFDALVGNVDRSWRNPNMLFWHGQPYLIDHGATLTFQHNWAATPDPGKAYDATEHALIGADPQVAAADRALASLVSDAALREAAALVPQQWLADEPGFDDAGAVRDAYVSRIAARLAARELWLPPLLDAVAAHTAGVRTPRRRNRPDWLTERERQQ